MLQRRSSVFDFEHLEVEDEGTYTLDVIFSPHNNDCRLYELKRLYRYINTYENL